MNEPNIPLLRKEVEWVEQQQELIERGIPAEWYQPAYVAILPDDAEERFIALQNYRHPICGTAYCVAGHVAAELDQRFARRDSVRIEDPNDPIIQMMPAGWRQDFEEEVQRDGWTEIDSATVARVALGIVTYDGGLFGGCNTASDIREIAEGLAGEKL